jgi:hypothetical protein
MGFKAQIPCLFGLHAEFVTGIISPTGRKIAFQMGTSVVVLKSSYGHRHASLSFPWQNLKSSSGLRNMCSPNETPHSARSLTKKVNFMGSDTKQTL